MVTYKYRIIFTVKKNLEYTRHKIIYGSDDRLSACRLRYLSN